MDLASNPKTWDTSFPDLPKALAKHGFVFVAAVGKFYSVGGSSSGGMSVTNVYSISFPSPTSWSSAG